MIVVLELVEAIDETLAGLHEYILSTNVYANVKLTDRGRLEKS
jgi:hypothetical protein